MKKYLIQLEVAPQLPHRVWINHLDAGNRYILPQEEYQRRYISNGFSEAENTDFEWGYTGTGPRLLARAIADEILNDKPSSTQNKLILDKVMSAPHGEDSEFELEF
ncbi:MAG: DUF6166 domain-containing protein [Cyclobacteriaceae bacterium]